MKQQQQTGQTPDDRTTAPARRTDTTETATTRCLQIGRAKVTRQALILPPDATEEECETIIELVSYLDDATPWWRGDAILHAETIHGEKYAQWVNILGTSEGYLRNLVWVCSVFPPEDRHPHLSYKHHQVVASVKDRDRRLSLLEEAYREGLSASELYERARGVRLIIEGQASNKGFKLLEEPADLDGVRGEIVSGEGGTFFSYRGGMVKLLPRIPKPVCAVCGQPVSYTEDGDTWLIQPCNHGS